MKHPVEFTEEIKKYAWMNGLNVPVVAALVEQRDREIITDALLHAAEICDNNRNYLSARDIRAEAEQVRNNK